MNRRVLSSTCDDAYLGYPPPVKLRGHGAKEVAPDPSSVQALSHAEIQNLRRGESLGDTFRRIPKGLERAPDVAQAKETRSSRQHQAESVPPEYVFVDLARIRRSH